MCLFVGKPQKFILNWVGVGVRVHKRRKLEWVIIKSKEIPNLPSDLSRIRIRPRASVGVGIIIIIPPISEWRLKERRSHSSEL